MKIIDIIILFLFSVIIVISFVEIPIPEEQGTIKIYFTYKDDVEEILKQTILQSKEIKCAFYDVSDEFKLFLEKNNVELILHNESHKGLMHNKFCILDAKKIISGSMNPTFRGMNKNNNNLIIIESKLLAKNFLSEFEELKNIGKQFPTLNKKTRVSGILIENYFCPEDSCKEKVLSLLDESRESIIFMTFSFTDDDIGELIYQKTKHGVYVKGIFEKTQATNIYSEYVRLQNYSIIDSNSYNMHHKVFIIDEEIVITGSYNPSKNGNENNDENILIIRDDVIAYKFLKEFHRLLQ
jgi:phosphatidylserine/phosphatidylglycerophosphate/cardiolipin synthase-like enzyme